MKYKYIPEPVLMDDEEKRPLYRKDENIFIVGWEIGHYVPANNEETDFPDYPEEHKEWEKLREVMELTPEQEEEWQRQQGLLPPTVSEQISQVYSEMSASYKGGVNDV